MPQRGIFPDQAPLGPALAPAGRGLFPLEPTSTDPLRRTLDQAAEQPAAEAARVFDLRLKTGLPEAVIRRNRPEIEAEVTRRDFDPETFRASYPKLSAWLAEDATRAAVAQPDLQALQRFEHTLSFGASILRGVDQVQGMTGGFLEAVGEAVGAEGLATYGRDVRTFNARQAEDLGPRTSVFALRGPWDLAQWLKETVGEQMSVMAPILAGGAVGAGIGSVLPGGGTVVGGLLGAFVPSFVLSVGEVQGNIKDVDPEASAPAAAFIGGSAIAALDSVLPGRVGGTLVRTFGRETAEALARRALLAPVKPAFLRSTVGGTVRGMAIEGLTEAFQEAIGAEAAAAGTGTGTPEDLWRQMVEAGAAGAVMGGVAEGGTVAATVRRQQARVIAAQQQTEFFNALATGATESTLIKDLPAAAQEFLQRATAGGPLEHVYAPVEPFVEYWQSKGINPALVAQELTGSATALEEARAAGTDLVIPTAAYAVKVAPTEHHAFFAQELRLRPDAANAREAAELHQVVEAQAEDAARVGRDPTHVVSDQAREAVRLQVVEQALAAGARPEVADAWASLWADRVVARAARLGVDPVVLLEQQPVPTITSDMAAPIVTPPVEIPASPARKNETPAQRATRTTAHLAALASSLLRDARRVDPRVDEATIRRELETRLAFEQERQGLQRETGAGQDLLRAIAGYGGLWWETRTGGYRGEVEGLVEAGRDIKGVAAGSGRVRHTAGRATYNGVAGVFNEIGLPPDTILASLRQDQRFEHLEDINDFWDALAAALRAEADVDALPGTADLRALGIVPGTPWWDDAWDTSAVEDVDESATEGDVSFNVEELNQRIERAIESAETRLAGLTPASNTAGSRVVPFPTIPNAIASRLFRAAALAEAQPTTVAVSDLVATQETVSEPTVREKLDAAGGLPLALQYRGHYFLADGTHRATAAWARGDETVDVLAAPVSVDKLRALEQQEQANEFFQRAEKAKAARAAARAAPRDQSLAQDDGRIKGAFNPATNTIRLIAGKADLSTFLHESGHAFLEELVADAALVDVATPAHAQIRADAETTLRWFGFQGTVDEWRAQPVDARRDHHEQFARAFEDYLYSGQAPSAELRTIFARFRTWLLEVYTTLRRQHVEVSPEIRGVMDRLLATDEAIAATIAEQQVEPLFANAAQAGTDAAGYDSYRTRYREARTRAIARVDVELLAEFKRERHAWWKQEQQAVRAIVVDEVMGQPALVAQSVMRTGKLPNGAIPPYGDGAPLKVSRADVVASYGKDRLKALKMGRDYLYAVEGGLPADTLAELMGFPNGDALLSAVSRAPRVERVIADETERRMHQKHGDMLEEQTPVRDAAETAVHVERFDLVAEELRLLSAKAAAAVAWRGTDTITAAATTQIARTKVRDLRPGLYLVAATRHSTTALEAMAADDHHGASQAKQQELVALALYRAARDAKARSQPAQRLGRKYELGGAALARIGTAGQDYVDQIFGLLDRYEFAKVPQQALDRRASLRKFVASLERDGLPVQIPEDVLDDARRINWQELTVEELEGVYETIRQIEHLARLKNRLVKANEHRELSAIRSEIATSIREKVTARPKTLEPRLATERAAKLFEGIFGSHRKIASLVRELDGFEDGGPLWEHVLRRINDAGNDEAARTATATAALVRLFNDAYTPAERARFGRKQWIEALGAATDPRASLSTQGRLLVALNWGNDTNRQRLMAGHRWTQAQVEAVLDTLDRRDWQFVQSVWDHYETYWPDIVAKQQRVVGLPPVKVDATPVFTRFGEFRGGYHPIKFEGQLSGKVLNLEEASAADMQKAAAYVHSTTARGHLETRAEGNVTLPVRLDFGVIWEHVGQVIHDVTHHEMLIDVGRILGGDEVQSAIYDTLGPVAFNQFRTALKDIALGDVPARHETEGALAHLRTGATVVGLGWSLTTVALQPLGLTQSINRIGVAHVAKGLSRWLRGADAMTTTVAGIHEKSIFMANRHRTMMREIHEITNRLGVDTGQFSGWLDAALRTVTADTVTKQGIADSYFWMIGRAQMVADMPTWIGMYEKAIADPATRQEDGTIDDARAVALADQAVLDSQGGGQVKDLAAVQRGGPAWKLWTNFYSFFNVTYNLWVESKRQAQAGGRFPRQPAAIGRLAVDYLMLFTVPAVLSSVLRDALRGDLDDDLEDPDAWAQKLVAEQLAYMAGTMVGVREIGGALQGYTNYEGPAGARGIAVLPRVVTQALQFELDESLLKSLNEAAGVLFHYPAAQVERTSKGIAALIDGRTENPLAVLVGPPRERR